ncbi:MAG: hypothetical protein KGH65_04370 [Candidatus Micrarchaeota archaeon]|nr:hypothetical protein [Candidatus Micrarchaeota archaeon]
MADTTATISLRKRLVKIHEPRRRKMAIKYLREAVSKISKVTAENVRIDQTLAQFMMINTGIRMSKLEIKITKDANKATVSLQNPPKVTVKPVEAKKSAAPATKKAEAKTEAKPAAAAPKPKKAAAPKKEGEAKEAK